MTNCRFADRVGQHPGMVGQHGRNLHHLSKKILKKPTLYWSNDIINPN